MMDTLHSQSELSAEELKQKSLTELVDLLITGLQAQTLPSRKWVETLQHTFNAQYTRAIRDKGASAEELELQQARLNDLLVEFRQKDKERQKAIEAQQAINLEQKRELLAQLEGLSADGVSQPELLEQFQAIRSSWLAIGDVDPQHRNEISKKYNELLTRFYDELLTDQELQKAEFDRNLTEKTEILKQIEELAQHPNTLEAHSQLSPLTTAWQQTAPVAPEERGEISRRYKEATTLINKRHQEYHEERINQEQENLKIKEGFCLRIEEINSSEDGRTPKQWTKLTQEVQDLQQRWRTTPSPRKETEPLYQRFRGALDHFFETKKVVFGELKDRQKENLAKKRELIRRAEELSKSEDWKNATNSLKQLQKEWEAIGQVDRQFSDEIWKEFRQHFDHFFGRLKANQPKRNGGQSNSLKIKQGIIEELQVLANSEPDETLSDTLHLLNQRWKEAGHVPSAVKDEINKQYRELLDTLHGRIRSRRTAQRVEGYVATLDKFEDKSALQQEHHRMQRLLQRYEQELVNYDNNLNFLSTSSSKGTNPLVQAVLTKREQLEREVKILKEKVERIAEKLAQ